MDYNNSDRLLFICALPGGSGYRLGRIISCFDNVYWYESKRNGKMPWNYFHLENVKGKAISPYHYDRRTNKNMIPLVGERVEKFWKKEDFDSYYKFIWPALMELAGAQEIINQGQYVSWVVHDSPEKIVKLFPNAKVINLIDENVDLVIERYKKTTALFPATIENPNIKPDYKNDYALFLEELETYNKHPSYRDAWAWQTFRISKFFRKLDPAYTEFLVNYMTDLSLEKNIQDSENILSMSWTSLNLDKIKQFLGSTSIDDNFKLLLESNTL